MEMYVINLLFYNICLLHDDDVTICTYDILDVSSHCMTNWIE